MAESDKTIPRGEKIKKPNDFWSWLVRTFYVMPGHPRFDADHSLVYTFDEGMMYYPTQDEQAAPIQTQAKWFAAYVFIWMVVVFSGGTADSTRAYLAGFLVGVFIIAVESFFYSTINNLMVMQQPERPYITNSPQVANVDKGEPLGDDLSKFIDFSVSGSGDYKVLINNKTLPQDGENGYIFSATTFLEKSSSGEFTSMDLENYLEGKRLAELRTSDKHKRYNPGQQNGVRFYSERVARLSEAAYYTGIIILTWGMYATSSKWGSSRQLSWNILAFMVAVIAGAVVVDSYDVVMYNNVIYIKKRLLILAISFAITGIFIV